MLPFPLLISHLQDLQVVVNEEKFHLVQCLVAVEDLAQGKTAFTELFEGSISLQLVF